MDGLHKQVILLFGQEAVARLALARLSLGLFELCPQDGNSQFLNLYLALQGSDPQFGFSLYLAANVCFYFFQVLCCLP